MLQMALKHHPDKNPNNPEATDKVILSLSVHLFCIIYGK